MKFQAKPFTDHSSKETAHRARLPPSRLHDGGDGWEVDRHGEREAAGGEFVEGASSHYCWLILRLTDADCALTR